MTLVVFRALATTVFLHAAVRNVLAQSPVRARAAHVPASARGYFAVAGTSSDETVRTQLGPSDGINSGTPPGSTRAVARSVAHSYHVQSSRLSPAVSCFVYVFNCGAAHSAAYCKSHFSLGLPRPSRTRPFLYTGVGTCLFLAKIGRCVLPES